MYVSYIDLLLSRDRFGGTSWKHTILSASDITGDYIVYYLCVFRAKSWYTCDLVNWMAEQTERRTKLEKSWFMSSPTYVYHIMLVRSAQWPF